MANHGQLTVLNSSEAAALSAISKCLVAEVVRVSWPSPDGVKWYVWWPFDQDPAYADNIDWLGEGETLTPAFVADTTASRFHAIPETSAIGDDVVQFRFMNKDQEIETLCYEHGEGVRVEIFYWFPELPKLISRWHGHLRTIDAADADYVSITAATGFRSNDLNLPNRSHGIICGFHFGGSLTAAQVALGNPCPYDIHVGGSDGNLNPDTSQPFTECDGTKSDCIARLGQFAGDLRAWGGHDTVEETVPVGAGEHKTYSRTIGNESRLVEPKRVVYGTRVVRQLQLLASRKEYNPSEDHQDKGTFVSVWEVSEGPIESITEIQVNETEPLAENTLTRLGTLRQDGTGFSPNEIQYSYTALFRADLTQVDPATIKAASLSAQALVEGRNTVKVYTDEDTFTEEFSNNRAWCLLDLLTSYQYGHRLDKDRYTIDDFLYLAALESPFDCDVQGSRTAQQQIADICASAMWFLPFNHNGITRILPMEDVDLEADDIPEFRDALGPTRNILWDDNNSTSRLTVEYDPDSVIPNEVIVTIDDAEHRYVERPLRIWDEAQQRKAGEVYGDNTLRKVEKTFVGYGLTQAEDAVNLGRSILSIGPYMDGGIDNNCRVTFYVPTMQADVLNLHPNKIIRVVSNKLDPYLDPSNNPFEFFRIKGLYTQIEQGRDGIGLVTRVVAQAYSSPNVSVCDTAPSSSGLVFTDAANMATPLGINSCSQNGLSSFRGLTASEALSYAQTDPTMDAHGDRISFNAARDGTQMWCGLREDVMPAGNPSEGGGAPPDDWWDVALLDYAFYFHQGANTVSVVQGDGSDAVTEVTDTYAYTVDSITPSNGTLFTIRLNDGFWQFLLGSAVIYTVAATVIEPRFTVMGNSSSGSPDFNEPGVVNVTAWVDPCLPHTGGLIAVTGGESVVLDPAPTAAVPVDRIFRDEDLYPGVPGFYIGMAPTNETDAWAAATLYVDRGGGYTRLITSDTAAILGESTGVLAGTELGSETVQVQLQPGQELTTFTGAQIAAGQGYYYLGGEIFQAQTPTQDDTDPNLWTLSDLSNRGAYDTSAFQGTHAIGDQFLWLDDTDSVLFVKMRASDVGQTYNYKAVTAGQDIDDVTPFSFTLSAPDFEDPGEPGPGGYWEPVVVETGCDRVYVDCDGDETIELVIADGDIVMAFVEG